MNLPRCSRCALALAAVVSSLASQEPAPSRSQQRVAAAKLEEERFVRWGEAGLPALPTKVSGLSAAFSGDGRFLVLQIGSTWNPQLKGAWTCIDTETGKSTELPVSEKTLCGGIPGPRVYGWHQGGLSWVKLPAGEIEEVIPAGPAPRVRGGMVHLTNESMRPWYVAPDGTRAITMPPQIIDLSTEASIPFADKRDCPVSAAWDVDRQRVAVSVHKPGGKSSLQVMDSEGKSLATFAEPTAWYSEFDLGGRFVWWTGPKLCRGEIATGQVTVLKDGPDQVWFWQVDPVLGIGCDGTEFTLWDLNDLQAVRRVPIDEKPPAPAVDRVEPEVVGPKPAARFPEWTETPDRMAVGCVLLGGVAATQRRERIALATFAGVRIYRVKN